MRGPTGTDHAPVLLLSTSSSMGYSTVRALQDAGRPYRLLARGRYPSLRWSRWCLGGERFPGAELRGDALARRVVEELRLHGLAAVVPVGIDATLYLARYQALLPPGTCFPLADRALLDQLNDKWRFCQLLTELGLPTPRTHRVHDLAEAAALPLPFPVVVKPLAAEASQGVLVAADAGQLRDRVAAAVVTGRTPLLVQEHIAGVDQGVSALVDHGRVLACRVQRGDSGASLDYVDEPDVLALLETLVKATGFHGVLNVDLRRAHDGSLWVIECNPRLYFTVHLAAKTGANLVGLGLELLSASDRANAGDPPPVELAQAQVTCVREALPRWLRRRPLNAPSLALLRDEVRDPLASLLRKVEDVLGFRAPGLRARMLDEPAPSWGRD